MTREVLSNGVIVPEKYTRDWFDDFRTNLVKLNDAITAIAGKQNALTQEQLNAVNSAITAQKVTDYDSHIADTSKHLTDDTAPKAIADEDGTNIKTGYGKLAGANTWTDTNTFRNINPETNSTYALGSSSYQWSSVYAQTYYYNGTQWGLDKSNEWTASNIYSAGNAIIIKNNSIEIGNEPSAYTEQKVVFNDKNGYGIAAIKYQNQLSSSNSFVNGLEFSASDKFNNGVRDATGTTITNTFRIGLWNDGTKYIYSEGRWRTSLIPFTNKATDLGTSTNQWKSVYSQTYYYNGTAWGLDQANVWTSTQTIKATSPALLLRSNVISKGTIPSARSNSQIFFRDNSDNETARVLYRADTDGTRLLWIAVTDVYSNGALDPAGSSVWNSLILSISPTGQKLISINSDLIPDANICNLGSSANKWKTLNGINPGALSLPDFTSETGVSLSAGANTYTPTFSGWLSISTTGDISVVCGNFCHKATDMISVPVIAGKTYTVTMPASATGYFYSCLGNV